MMKATGVISSQRRPTHFPVLRAPIGKLLDIYVDILEAFSPCFSSHLFL